MNFLQALGMLIFAAALASLAIFMIDKKYADKYEEDTKKIVLKQRDYQLDIYDTTITLYRGNGLYYVGEASVNKLDSLIMEDNR